MSKKGLHTFANKKLDGIKNMCLQLYQLFKYNKGLINEKKIADFCFLLYNGESKIIFSEDKQKIV